MVLGKIERVIGIKLRGKDRGQPLAPPGKKWEKSTTAASTSGGSSGGDTIAAVGKQTANKAKNEKSPTTATPTAPQNSSPHTGHNNTTSTCSKNKLK